MVHPLSPVRFGAVYKFDNPSDQDLAVFAQSRDKKNEMPIYMVCNKPTDTYESVTALTLSDAMMGMHAFEVFETHQKDLANPNHAPQKTLDLRFVRQMAKLTGAYSPTALLDWYLQTPANVIESTHQAMQTWSQRHAKRYRSAAAKRDGELNAKILKAHKEGRLLQAPSARQ